MRSESRPNDQMAELNTENPYVWWQQGTAIDMLAFPAKCLSRCKALHFNIAIWHRHPGEESDKRFKADLKWQSLNLLLSCWCGCYEQKVRGDQPFLELYFGSSSVIILSEKGLNLGVLHKDTSSPYLFKKRIIK